MSKILIAEDEKAIATALVLKLQHEGLDAETVNNGKEALERLESGDFDLLVLDLVMPVMDGFTVLEEIKKRKIQVLVMVASNLSQKEDEKRTRDLGAIDFFVKSNVSISELVENIQKALVKKV